jgi:5'(3')-deoxyribonucleotidase
MFYATRTETMPKATLLLDCDGVLADLHTPWYAMHNAECRICQEPLTYDKVVTWDTHKYVACGKAIYSYLARPELWTRPRPLPLARPALVALSPYVRPVVVTSIPAELGQQARLNRIAWIRTHFSVVAAHDIVITDKKDSVSGDILVEDRTATLNSHPAEGICIAHPWNQDYAGTRVADWKEAYVRIRQYLS